MSRVCFAEQFRFTLTRELGLTGPRFAFFGVNPSTADQTKDDATVRKWIGFTGRWGGRSFVVCNIIPWRATNIKDLKSITLPEEILQINRSQWKQAISQADFLVPCWGARSKIPEPFRPELEELKRVLFASGKPVMHLGLTKDGDPKHPLMLGYSTSLNLWSPER